MVRIRQPFIKSRKKFRLALAAICLSFFAVTASATAGEFDVNLREMQILLRKGDFDALEQRIAALEQTYADDKASDRIIERGYGSFAVIDPRFEPRLEAWIKAKPESHRPHIARGFYYRNLGWLYRGGRYADQTSDERIGLMRKNFAIAVRSLKTALEFQPRSGVAYAILIDMQMAAGDRDEMNALFRAGLEADPNSFAVRRNIFNSLLPWWGGYSQDPEIFAIGEAPPDTPQPEYPVRLPEAMLRFDQFVKNDPNRSPHLAPLRGLTDYAVATILGRDERELEAAIYFKRAMAHGDYWFFHRQEGRNFTRMERYNDAIASYTRALELWPDNPNTLERRARAYRSLKAYINANADVDKALALNPKDPDLLLLKANILWALGRFRAAVKVLDGAIEYGALDDDIWDARGRLYLYKLNNPKRAIPDLKRATELDPTDSDYWYNYAGALFRAVDCEALKAYRHYLDVCPKYGNECFEAGVKYAYEIIEEITDSGECG